MSAANIIFFIVALCFVNSFLNQTYHMSLHALHTVYGKEYSVFTIARIVAGQTLTLGNGFTGWYLNYVLFFFGFICAILGFIAGPAMTVALVAIELEPGKSLIQLERPAGKDEPPERYPPKGPKDMPEATAIHWTPADPKEDKLKGTPTGTPDPGSTPVPKQSFPK